MRPDARQTAALTLLALVAFAANSVLCRLALKDGLIDAVSFTQIRLVSGALTLAPFLIWKPSDEGLSKAFDGRMAAALFVYAIAFSLSYVSVNAGAGALILFGAVQLTMLAIAFAQGERPGPGQLAGVALAFAGLIYLLAPGLSAPPLGGATLMSAAGIAWGVYSSLGKTATSPERSTAANFLVASLAALALFAVTRTPHLSLAGVCLAVASGAIASGAGYVIWYRALRALTAVRASVVQLAVPVIAAIGGLGVIGEPITARLAIAGLVILGGIFIVIRSKN